MESYIKNIDKDTLEFVHIDGSHGEGGGQIFRTSLTLAMCLCKPVRISRIRNNRKKPGLLRQHLTCLRAAQEISQAKVEGDFLGSQEVTFIPGKVSAGSYRFAVGSAGSASLVFQTVLLPLMFAGGQSKLLLEGGTHNGSAPSFDFIKESFAPVMKKMGYELSMSLERYGFYPAGGGAWKATIYPVAELQRLTLLSQGKVKNYKAVVTSARLPEHVGQRELAKVRQKLDWDEVSLEQKLVSSVGPGNIVSLRVNTEASTEIVEVVGEKHLRAEKVADNAISEMQRYLNSPAVVGEHLADQILLPMVLGLGGSFTMLPPSLHFKTNVSVIKIFIDINISYEALSEDNWKVIIRKD